MEPAVIRLQEATFCWPHPHSTQVSSDEGELEKVGAEDDDLKMTTTVQVEMNQVSPLEIS